MTACLSGQWPFYRLWIRSSDSRFQASLNLKSHDAPILGDFMLFPPAFMFTTQFQLGLCETSAEVAKQSGLMSQELGW